ncbi:MAG: hypothetical protein GXP33_15730 [Spirochaetes bacterium]|nr:hypothetical protein [Spirochaetota bacterium]
MKIRLGCLIVSLMFITACNIESTSSGNSSYHKNGYDCYSPCHETRGTEFNMGTYEADTAAGTVFIDLIGSSAAEGAVVTAVSDDNKSFFKAETDSFGNFVITGLDTDERYYFTILYGEKSSSSLGTGMGFLTTGGDYISCNQSGCHDTGRRLYP